MRSFIVISACLLIAVGCAKKESPSNLKYPELKFAPPALVPHRYTLNNGVTAFIVEDGKLPVLDIHARFRTGGLMESPAEEGMASLTASLMEEGGTKSIPADSLDELLEFHAISLSSDADFTGAMVSLSCLTEKTDLGLDLFNKVLREPAFEEKKLNLSKQRIIEAIRHRFDSPGDVLRIAGRYAFYGRNGWSELLSEKDVSRVDRVSLNKFYQTYFKPENMIIGVSGRFKTQEMLEKLNRTVGAWKMTDKKEAVFPVLPLDYKKRFYFVEKDINQAYVRMGAPLLLQRPHPDYYPVILMNWVLGGASFTSRISKKIREQEGLAYSAGSSVVCEYFYPGSFNVVLQTKSASTAYAIDLVFQEIRVFLKDGALESELAEGKQGLIDAFPSGFKTGDKITRAFTYNHYVKESDDNIDKYCERIRAVTSADIRRVAEKYLKPDSLSIVIVGKYAECEKGDNTHKASLKDFGAAEMIPEKELNKLLGGE